MNKMVAKLIEVGLITLATITILFDIIMWCHNTTTKGYKFSMLVRKSTQSRFFGNIAGTYILYSFPIILCTIIATIYLAFKQRYPSSFTSTRCGRHWRLLWTHPVFINKIFGILNSFDIALIVTTLFVTLWMFLNEYLPQARVFDKQATATLLKWNQAGLVLGRISAFPISLLFIPVARSSPLLRMIDIPFEQAIRYHRWLGHLTMTIVSGHVGIFIGIFAYKHQMVNVVTWPHTGISCLAGFIAFIVGVIMWITALSFFRRHSFNLFYYAHQLYWIFFAFFVYHVGVQKAGYCMGSVFLYFIDRFFRFQQSRRKMFISSAKILSNDVMELKIPKSSNLKFNAISALFINIPSISSLEWHPFSVASSPLDEKKDITIYIKPYGITGWTQHLHTLITKLIKNNESRCPFATKIYMEGPYGHESDYFLRYNTLLLIAGGIGITPFLAMISDILHRYGLEQRDLPKHVHLIWIVKSTKDCQLLQQLSPTSIYPNLQSSNLNIVVDVYVTKEQSIRGHATDILSITMDKSSNNSTSTQKVVSTSIGHNLWMMLFIIISTVATIVIFGVFQQYIVDTRHFDYGSKIPQWIHVSLFFVSLILGISGVGGVIIAFWNAYFDYKEKNTNKILNSEDNQLPMQMDPLYQPHHFPRCDDIETGSRTLLHKYYTKKFKGRPDFAEVFATVEKKFSNEDIGVLVSGPESLQLDVANECRNQASNNYMKAQIFNFHSVSFDL